MSNIIFVFYLYIGIYDWYLEIIIMEIKSKIKKKDSSLLSNTVNCVREDIMNNVECVI